MDSTELNELLQEAKCFCGVTASLEKMAELGLLQRILDASGYQNPHAMFSSSQTITAAVPATAYPITFTNIEDITEGITYTVGGSQIGFTEAGNYLIAASAVVDITNVAGNPKFHFWTRVNGTDVPRSNTIVAAGVASVETTLAVTFNYDFVAGDYLEFMYAVTSINARLLATAATAYSPACPSIIVTINKTSN